MPSISLQSILNKMEHDEAVIRRNEQEKKQIREEKRQTHKRVEELLMAGIGTSGAAMVGFVHGRYEDADGNLFIPRTSLPGDILAGLFGVSCSFFLKLQADKEKEKRRAEGRDREERRDMELLGDAAFSLSTGVLAGATAMYFRKHALAGKQANKFWAGVPELYGPQTHNHPSIGAAPVVTSMTDSELAMALRRAF